jgi:acetate kinase
MSEAIAVLNAGSSSIKFSLFGGADLELVVRGQAEAIHTAPRFVAKDRPAPPSRPAWGEGSHLGHDGALQHIVDSCASSSAIRNSRASGTVSFTAGSSTPNRCASTARC